MPLAQNTVRISCTPKKNRTKGENFSKGTTHSPAKYPKVKEIKAKGREIRKDPKNISTPIPLSLPNIDSES